MSPSCGSHLTASTTESNQWMLLRVPVGAALQWLICSRPPGGTWTNLAPTTTTVSLHDLLKKQRKAVGTALKMLVRTSRDIHWIMVKQTAMQCTAEWRSVCDYLRQTTVYGRMLSAGHYCENNPSHPEGVYFTIIIVHYPAYYVHGHSSNIFKTCSLVHCYPQHKG